MKENWQQVGSMLERLCSIGFFPAIGYDRNGWEAWVFFDAPIQGSLGNHAKVCGDTATEAMEKLIHELEERKLIPTSLAPQP